MNDSIQVTVISTGFNTVEINKEEALAFQQKISDLQRAVRGAEKILSGIDTRVKYVKVAVESVPQLPLSLMPKVKKAEVERLASFRQKQNQKDKQ